MKFEDKYFFLDVSYPCKIIIEDGEYTSVEHAYHAFKTLDRDERNIIKAAKDINEVRKLSEKITVRPYWDDVRLLTMYSLLKQKFSYPELAKSLSDINEDIVYDCLEDKFWGKVNGEGDNNLGELLTNLKDNLSKPGKKESKTKKVSWYSPLEEINLEDKPLTKPTQHVENKDKSGNLWNRLSKDIRDFHARC